MRGLLPPPTARGGVPLAPPDSTTYVNEIVAAAGLAAAVGRFVCAPPAVHCFCESDRRCFYAMAFCGVSDQNHHVPIQAMAGHTRPAQPSGSWVDRSSNVKFLAATVANSLHQCLADADIAKSEKQRKVPRFLAPNVDIGHTWRRLLVENPLELSLSITI